MKRFFVFTAILLIVLGEQGVAQSPPAFSYQAVARNQDGAVLTNQEIGLRITLYDPADKKVCRYVETHEVITNAYGLLDIKIGLGYVQEGKFDSLDWSKGSYFIKVEMDQKGGNNYHEMGMSQLLSVPYAMYAEHTKPTSVQESNPSDELQTLSLSNDTLYLSQGGFVKLPVANSLSTSAVWKKNDEGISYSEGKVGIGTTSPESQLQIVDNADKNNGKSRQFVFLKNTSNSYSSHTAIAIHSGTNTNFNNGSFGVTPNSYSLIRGYQGYTYLMGSNNGLLFRARDPLGHIRFLAGGEGDQYEHMRIEHNGNVGLGTMSPTSKLQINDGDIFIEDIDRGIIMKSPNGQCWRVTVSDNGEFVSTKIDCQ